jgi:hypothetical protein
MKSLFPAGMSLLALVACTAEPSPPPAAGAGPGGQPVLPASYAAGSPANTTTAFDGRWVGDPVQNMSSGNALPAGGENYSTCPNYTVPTLTISHGLAQVSALNQGSIYQGYVTPQGALVMLNGLGGRFVGQIDSQNVLKGRIIGACVYGITWRKSA